MPTLADIYSAIGSAKRNAADFVQNPGTSLQQMVGYANDRARTFNQQGDAAAAEFQQTQRLKGPQQMQLAQQLAEGYNPAGMTVYHGSRHPFTQFDKSKIGSGEGNQSYGYGIYVAENPNVAKEYTTAGMSIDPSKTKYKGRNLQTWYDEAQRKQDMAYRQKASNEKIAEINSELGFWESLMTRNHPKTMIDEYLDPENASPAMQNFAKNIDINKFKGIVEQPNFYKVDLPDPHISKMLDWDAPIHQQTPEVKALADAYGVPHEDLGGDLLAKVGKGSQGAKVMQDAGITGIKYFDAQSRAAEQGTRNMVVFDPAQMKILERNQQAIE